MPNPVRTFLFTAAAMLAFAGNSLLCRAALGPLAMDAADFTALRLAAGALMLMVLLRLRRPAQAVTGNWPSALALLSYAAAFSFAYLQLTTATGALLLFGAVQLGMTGFGLWRGERLAPLQWLGLSLALGGLLILLAPGLTAPPWQGALLMLAAGLSWAIYSLRGRGGGDALAATAGNFLRAAPLALLMMWLMRSGRPMPAQGIACALASGALASGVGYALWYTALPALPATTAATVQLSVPVIAALGGSLWLGEAPGLRLLATGLAILAGIALVTRASSKPARSD
jgi:drug/metabolite transporter (DMT)-like permease